MSGSTTSFLFNGQPTPPQPTGSDTSTSYPLWLQDYTYGLAGAAQNLASQPYTQFPGPQVASPSDATQQSWNMALGNVGNYQPALNNAATATYYGSLPTDVGNINAPSPINFSQLNAPSPVNFSPVGTPSTINASSLSGSDIQKYMNPYMDQVIGGLTSASNNNLFQNVLPSVQDRFVSAGQSRSPQEMQSTNNAVYQSQQALDQAIGGALNTGYQGALSTAQQQQAQQLQTQLQQQGVGLGVAEQNQSLGLQNAQQQQGFQTAFQQQQQQLGLSTAEQQQGVGLGVQQQNQTLALQQQQANRAAQQAAGAQYGQIGALTQQLGAADTGQVAAAGQAQDVNSQANINAALNNFYAQQQWPYQNLTYASNIIRGQAEPSNTQQVGLQYNPGQTYSASPLSSFIGTTLGASALGTAATSLKKGGRVKHRGALNAHRKAA